jgi:subtilisin family serine protease
MIDAGIDKHHPALTNDEIVAGNVTGSVDAPVTAHGTAVASLLVGRDRDFHGQLPGATLYAADVFGGLATGGSALDIARALDWLAQNHVAVVNASLAGPPNSLLAAAVKSFIARGHVLVAAAGNAGPAAPPAYPAAYDGVIGVTSVDAKQHLQVDANRGDVAFAALGVSVRAATVKKGYDTFTGTSFAAPVVAAQFALMVRTPDVEAARNASKRLAKSAVRLGEQSAFGYGYVGAVGSIAAQ